MIFCLPDSKIAQLVFRSRREKEGPEHTEEKKNRLKPVYNDLPRNPKIVAVVDRWSLFRAHLHNETSNWGLKIVAVVDRWSLFGGGR